MSDANVWPVIQTYHPRKISNEASSTTTNLIVTKVTSTNSNSTFSNISKILTIGGTEAGTATTTLQGGTATSTFGGGVRASALDITGTSTVAGLQLSAGCFRGLDGNCLTSGSGVSLSDANVRQ